MTEGIVNQSGAQLYRQRAHLADYIRIARLDHSTKHIFIIPGIVLAYVLRGVQSDRFVQMLFLGFATAVFIASANYVINEWLDRDFDKHHPTKSRRSAVQRTMNGKIVLLEWAAFVTAGLGCAIAASPLMFVVACIFALQGVVYNVPPVRSKDRAYLDVISESINNALRLMIGWAIVDPSSIPPASIILSFWCGGAFLMAAKRLSEYREITASHGPELLALYRASFAGYSEMSLTCSCFAYSLLSISFLSVFLIKYRAEYILVLPFVMILFVYYLVISVAPGSSAQNPEKLHREHGLLGIVVAIVVLFTFTTFVDMPAIASLAEQHYIGLP